MGAGHVVFIVVSLAAIAGGVLTWFFDEDRTTWERQRIAADQQAQLAAEAAKQERLAREAEDAKKKAGKKKPTANPPASKRAVTGE